MCLGVITSQKIYIIETQEGTDYYYNNTEVYYSNEFTFDADTGKFSLVDPQQDVASAISMIGKYCMTNGSTASFVTYIKSLKTSYSNRKIYNITKYTSFNRGESGGTYALIVGNGNSDDKRSNAHTLDWEGNAWFAGNVYVGSTSGTNKDEGSVRLATEDQLTFCARVLIMPTQNDDGTIAYSASFPALVVYGEIFKGHPVALGNSVECCLMPIEHNGPLTVLNYTGLSIDQNSDGNTVLTVRFSSYVSGKHISAEIKDTISGFRTDDEEILNTVVTVTESASLPIPTTAQVGQIVKVKAVDESGKITETETVNMPMPKTLKWITVHSSDLTETKRELIISTGTDGKSIVDYNPVGLSLIVSTPADATVESNNGTPWIYPSTTKFDNAIRVIGSISGWKTIARDSAFVFNGGSSAMSCSGNVNTSLPTYKLDGYALDGVRIFFNSANDHLPVGTHVEVSILCEVEQ